MVAVRGVCGLEERVEIAGSVRTQCYAPFPQFLHNGFAIEQFAAPRPLKGPP